MRFSKLHGLGNDFVLFDCRAGEPIPSAERAIALCDRRRGIGADGVLALTPSREGLARMTVLNADGSRARMCGNGLRCAALHLARATGRSVFDIETDAGPRRCQVDDPWVEIEMGRPSLAPADLPMVRANPLVAGAVEIDGERLVGTAVSMGNPHLVLFDVPASRAADLGPRLERHPWFPDRVNVGFAAVASDGLDLVVWERGAGLTLACGTGACAAAVAAVLQGVAREGEPLHVRLSGGILDVTVHEGIGQVSLRGPAAFVFEGAL